MTKKLKFGTKMIFESKFRDQNDIPHGKFLLNQLTFNGRTNGSMTEGPKQYDFLILRTKVESFKK